MAATALAALIALAVYNLGGLLDWYCEGKETVASLNLKDGRAVVFTADRCWENDARAIYYRVEDGTHAVVPTTFIGADVEEEWRQGLKVVYAEGGEIIGVVAPNLTPPIVMVMHDFKTGETWPRPKDNETPCAEAVKGRRLALHERLKAENPGLPPPADYCD